MSKGIRLPWRFEMTLAARFLREGRGQTVLILSGIGVGVAVLVFLTALISSLQESLIESTVGRSPHLVLTRRDIAAQGAAETFQGLPVVSQETTRTRREEIPDWPLIVDSLSRDSRIKAVLPVALGPGFVRRGDFSRSVSIRGVDLAQADRIYQISSRIKAGSKTITAGTILLGSELARDLGVNPGDALTLTLPDGRETSILVGGIFDLGVQAPNRTWIVMSRERAASLLGTANTVTVIEAQVFSVFGAQAVATDWRVRLPGLKVDSWQESNRELLSGIRGQSNSSVIIQVFVLLSVTLGVASVLAISALQRSRQIGILKAIGMRTGSVARIFLFQGVLLGLIGSGLGCLLGLLLTQGYVLIGQKTGAVLFPIQLKAQTLLVMAGIATLASAVAAYVPARRSAKIDPIEVIRGG